MEGERDTKADERLKGLEQFMRAALHAPMPECVDWGAVERKAQEAAGDLWLEAMRKERRSLPRRIARLVPDWLAEAIRDERGW